MPTNTFGLMPWTRLVQIGNDGNVLAGGKISFYRAGTTTPLDTYADANGSVVNPNPVVLDDYGSAKIFMQAAKYHIFIHDKYNAQVYEIDNIGPSAGATFGGTGAMAVVSSYNDLRNLDQDYDVVVVLGRNVPADGGYGVFLKQPITELSADDDGVMLIRATSRYKRSDLEYIDPIWYGVQYNTIANINTQLANAMTRAVAYNVPVHINGPTYIVSSITVPSGCDMRVHSYFYAPDTDPMLTFADNARILFADDGAFRLPVTIGANCTTGPILSSWFTGGFDTVIARLSAISTYNYTIVINAEYNLAADVHMPSNLDIDFASGGKLTISLGPIDIRFESLIYQGESQIIEYTSIDNIGNVTFDSRRALPEWFGAVGDNTTNDAIAVQACVRNERVQLKDSSSYRVTQAIDCPTVVTFYGNLVAAMSTNAPINDVSDVPTPRLFLDPATSMDVLNFSAAGQLALVNVGLAMGSNAAMDAGVVNGTFNALGSVIYATNATGTIKSQHVAMSNSVINALTVFSASAIDLYLDNVRDDSNYARRKFAHDSSFKSIYLEEEAGESATFDNVLTTRNADGLVEGKHTLHLESLTIQSIVTEAESLTGNTTYIEVEIYDNLGTQAYRVRRDGTQIAGSTSTPAYIQYDIRADDKPNTVVRYYGVTAGIPVYIVPKNKPSGSDVLRVISIENRVFVGKGDTSPSVTYNAYNVELNGDSSILTGNRMAVNGYYYGGKWSIG